MREKRFGEFVGLDEKLKLMLELENLAEPRAVFIPLGFVSRSFVDRGTLASGSRGVSKRHRHAEHRERDLR